MAAPLGPSVRLRPTTPDDARTILAWYNDPEIVAPFDRFGVDDLESLRSAIAAAPSDPASLAPRYAVELGSESGPIGVVGHYRAHPVLEYLDVWYVLGRRDLRGRGYGKEAVRLLIDALFTSESLERVGATCDIDNLPSVRLLEGLGFRREGTLRAALFHHAAWHDVHVYGITRPEWASRRR